MSVTLDDVAKRAGVSPKTVSRAVNGEKGLSEATREKILRLAEEMNYVPNKGAQNLASGKTQSIALHFPFFTPKLISERVEMGFVTGIGEEAAQANYHFTLFTGQLDPRKLTHICRASIADGIILMQVRVDDWRVETLRKLHFPFVMIGRCQDYQDLNYIDLDFENAVVKAYDHLVNLGHQKIGFFTYPESWRIAGLGPSIRAMLGFQQAIKRYSLEPIYYEMNLNVDDSRSCIQDAIRQHPDMTAMVALHNSIAVGAINAVQSIGKRIPDDYSLVGVSLGAGSELIIPPLTAVHWEGYEIGRQAANMLIDILNHQISAPKQVLVLPELDLQNSTSLYSRRE